MSQLACVVDQFIRRRGQEEKIQATPRIIKCQRNNRICIFGTRSYRVDWSSCLSAKKTITIDEGIETEKYQEST